MSKKLEGNGRWESSRMMLPEHREQYLSRRYGQQEKVKTELPTKEDLELVRDYVLLPMILTIVDKNNTEIGFTSYSLKSLYIKASQVLMARIHADLSVVRKKMKVRNIKVFQEERVDSAVHYRFVCRGYEDTFAMMRDVARAEISVRISRYVSEMFKP
ncbi:hypothetical protein [Paenibacillus lutimineralis]|uniref:Uncharacterized protein n=1 Tax=Paenibacillus lutimineralis TaxID=2707005 RepID=A0A3Q9IAB8_9BACL|nr:hypothetical protein [Paenibacillus lutimineralis]AZS14667.1 hypothetical protein EI981_09500 [Paenibacillus lutimineralis]